ncbi:MAG: DNA-directed RNA polymerase subunit beta [Candidatus Portnoybacteria bacterium CG06_land_8_20_14_3_00_39_12]|uniref:DNA-directed RNA polymerase subunit beta n=2 Tax=Candidatus Portnoyibacteriota TaxID=1817913 RepID=A0A2M7UHL7_9BACT|nr:MAG: DNA-directed RNA polymerase subunit beta [Parcubacteria group bacterium CG1_02_40_25]PIU75500.1 MAG: DNA-directed RNA polymerase subunit beta [Candidatus Portnoybacteria bacterium CG06_land_8_20_14_3_00_39_12]PIZ70706.1 MAG: DNA-directed RNA polymerase subunit beta [Candidatus Portnoybacteria bacterium CG_4_10_14_0_2_um_filter_39_11]
MSLPYKYFIRRPSAMALPNLLKAQTESYDWFLKTGLRELFDEVSPIKDWTGKELDLYFGDYYFEEAPRTERETKEHNLTYEAPMKCRIKLVNKKTNEIKEQEIFLGDFPMMTPRGTFIVNGVERVVISQLMRSPGVIFTMNFHRGKKLFGAKVIPNRGAWLEIETDANGVITVRIDRKRKVPVTSLLRAFGIGQDNKILATFKSVDKGEVKYIEKTIEKDNAKSQSDGILEVYRHIRPGELATVDTAKQLIDNMFFNFERYDLAQVGRWKFNQRLALKVPSDKEHRTLRPEDLIEVIKEIIRLNNDPEAKKDDVDHLGNRRVRTVGELLQNRLRVGLARLERIIKDKMSTLDTDTMIPAALVNARPIISTVREFFMSSALSQFMDQVNLLAELEHKRRVSALGPGGLNRERAGFDVRDVHSTYYGRICPIQTSEGPNIGLVGHLALYVRLNQFGFLETPYRKVIDGRATNEISYLDAYEEARHSIAHAGVELDAKNCFVNKIVAGRVKGEPSFISRNKIDYMDISPQQFISAATALIPFLEHDDANRALMGANMQRQAVVCIKPEAPLVGTGLESRVAIDSGEVLLSLQDGVVSEVDARHVKIKSKSGEYNYELIDFSRTNQFTSFSQRPAAFLGQKVKKGDVLANGSSTEDGELALGQNLLVAFMSWGGNNFEDAIILSQRLVKDDRFTSIHIEDFTCDVRETKLGPEVTTPDIPNVGEEKLKNLDEEGIVRIGAEVREGDILVGKISPKGEADLTAEERLLRAIFGEKARDVKDTSLVMPHGKRGRIVSIRIFSREQGENVPPGVIKRIQIEVAQLRRVTEGDKLAGRHGNKGVIAKILPEADMPYLSDGRPVDVILNTLGVVSRMNIGQILETHLGWAAHTIGYKARTPVLAGATEADIKEEFKKVGLPEDGKVQLRDGRTGEPFDRKATVGYIYMMKLNHLAEDKIHMRSIGPYSLITQQPLGSKAQFGGQRFGEMEVWALEGYGAAHILQEMLTIKSDDVIGRARTYESIVRSKKIEAPNIPTSFNVLLSELKALALNAELMDGDIVKTDDVVT